MSNFVRPELCNRLNRKQKKQKKHGRDAHVTLGCVKLVKPIGDHAEVISAFIE